MKALLNNDVYITEEILSGSWKNILGRLKKKKKTVEVIKERESRVVSGISKEHSSHP